MSWATLPFPEVFADKTSGNVKTLQSDYLESGQYPIVDQGQQIVGGYTNDEERLCSVDGPVIVFGDHTKAFKYIDFPFCIGADGTKILKPKIDADMRYLFHAARQIHIPDNGYSRHFKYLKRGEIPLPPLEEQRRIAGILDQADALRRLRTRALDKLGTLGQASFHEMFGDIVTPETLSNCDTVDDALSSGKLLMVQDGNHGERHPKVSDFSNEGTPFIMANCLGEGSLRLDKAYRLSDYWLDFLRKGFSQSGDVLLSHKGTLGETAIVPSSVPTLILSPQVTFYRPGDGLLPEYLQLFFRTELFQTLLRKMGDQSTRAYVGLTRQKDLPLFIPSPEDQRVLIKKVSGIQSTLKNVNHAITSHCELCASLQHRAFRGEL